MHGRVSLSWRTALIRLRKTLTQWLRQVSEHAPEAVVTLLGNWCWRNFGTPILKECLEIPKKVLEFLSRRLECALS